MFSFVLLTSLLVFNDAKSPPIDSLPRIVNGNPTTWMQYPFIARISWAFDDYNGSLFSICGASLLRKSYPALLLTAGHCINDYSDFGTAYGVLGANYRQQPGFQYQPDNYTQWEVITQFAFPFYDDQSIEYDVGIVVLDANLTDYDDYTEVQIDPLCYDIDNECCKKHDNLTIIGYGQNRSNGSATKTLEFVTMNYITPKECKEYYGKEVTKDMMCAYTENRDSCQGDSGGPLVRTGTNEQVGVVSWGYGCAQGYPGVYANIGLFTNWLEFIMDWFDDTSNNYNKFNVKLSKDKAERIGCHTFPNTTMQSDSACSMFSHRIFVLIPLILYVFG